MFYRTIGDKADTLAKLVAVALGASIPVSTALDNVLLLLLLLLGLLAHAQDIPRLVVANPVARAAWLLFGLLALGMSYGETPLGAAIGMLGKYADLALLPLFMLALRKPGTRRAAENAFLLSMLAILLLSTLVGLGMLAPATWMWRGALPENPAIFHSSITQNLFMAYAVFLALLRAHGAGRASWVWRLCAAWGMANILFMVEGRTGYVALFLLLGYWAWTSWSAWLAQRGRSASGWHLAIMALLGLGAIAATYQVAPRFQERVNEVISESRGWDPEAPSSTSTGQRLEFYYHTLSIVVRYPLTGVGTGGFPAAYAREVEGSAIEPTMHPHNEYLNIATQIGMAGLFALFYLFFTLWSKASSLPPLECRAARGLVLVMAGGCLFNSLLLDHGEGLFFAYMSALWFARWGDPTASPSGS